MPDLDAALAATRARFEDWLEEHGAESTQAVGWNDLESQALRFEVLVQVMEGEARSRSPTSAAARARCSASWRSAASRRRWALSRSAASVT